MINQALDLGPKAATHLPAPSRSERIKSPPPAPPTPSKAAPVVEELTFRHNVENWCLENDLQVLGREESPPCCRALCTGSQPLGNGKNGTLVYFSGDSLSAVQRKGPDQVDIKIDWESCGRARRAAGDGLAQCQVREAKLGGIWLKSGSALKASE